MSLSQLLHTFCIKVGPISNQGGGGGGGGGGGASQKNSSNTFFAQKIYLFK